MVAMGIWSDSLVIISTWRCLMLVWCCGVRLTWELCSCVFLLLMEFDRVVVYSDVIVMFFSSLVDWLVHRYRI